MTEETVTIPYSEMVAYEEKILAAEMDTIAVSRRAVILRSLIQLPTEQGGYKGDSYYPVGGTVASHEWDGEKWNWSV